MNTRFMRRLLAPVFLVLVASGISGCESSTEVFRLQSPVYSDLGDGSYLEEALLGRWEFEATNWGRQRFAFEISETTPWQRRLFCLSHPFVREHIGFRACQRYGMEVKVRRHAPQRGWVDWEPVFEDFRGLARLVYVTNRNDRGFEQGPPKLYIEVLDSLGVSLFALDRGSPGQAEHGIYLRPLKLPLAEDNPHFFASNFRSFNRHHIDSYIGRAWNRIRGAFLDRGQADRDTFTVDLLDNRGWGSNIREQLLERGLVSNEYHTLKLTKHEPPQNLGSAIRIVEILSQPLRCETRLLPEPRRTGIYIR